MKTFLTSVCLIAIGFSAPISDIQAQRVRVNVNIGIPAPPPPLRVVRSACPSPDHVWVDGRWVWDDYYREYRWSAGYWDYIPRRVYNDDYRDRKNKHRGKGYYKNHRRCD
jgi:hypothetical protein